MGAEIGRESLRDVLRTPRPVAVVLRGSLNERRVEQDEVEALAGHRCEQIPVPYIDLVFEMIHERVDAGAAHRGSVDIHRHDASRVLGGKYRTDSGAGAHVQDVPIALHEP